MWKLESDISYCPNRFPARGIGKNTSEGAGSWIVAYQEDTLNKYKKPLFPIKSQIKKSEKIILDFNFLQKKYRFGHPSELSSIDISEHGFNAVDANGFENFKNVAYINSSENYLPLDAYSHFPCLRELELPVCAIKDVNIENDHFKTLQVLDLSFNNVTCKSFLSLGTLENLRVLSLTGNRLESIPETANKNQKYYKQLEVLYLDDNHLCDMSQVFISLAPLPKLQELYLDNNNISTIPYLKLTEGKAMPVCDNLKDANDLIQPCNSTTGEVEDEKKTRTQITSRGEATNCNGKKQEEENVQTPRQFQPPFQNLKFLSITNNKIGKEKGILAIAGWPIIQQIDINNNPLVSKTIGEPPLLGLYLKEKCGINIERGHEYGNKRHKLFITNEKNRKVKTKVPKIAKQSVELLIESFRRNQPLPNINQHDDNIEDYSQEDYSAEVDQPEVDQPEAVEPEAVDDKPEINAEEGDMEPDSVFLTQVYEAPKEDVVPDENGKQNEIVLPTDVMPKEIVDATPKAVDPKYRGYEILLDAKPDINFIQPIGIQNNVRALRQILSHQLVLHSTSIAPPMKSHHTTPQQRHHQAIRWYKAPEKLPSKKEKFDKYLEKMQEDNKNVIINMKLEEALKSKQIKGDAEKLLKEVQEKYTGLDESKIRRKSANKNK